MKKFMCLLISVILCLSLVVTASAETLSDSNSDPTSNAIASELAYYETDKSLIGMEGVDFNNLEIGEKIYVYEYLSSGFNEIASAYLIFEDDDIVTLAYDIGGNRYQFMTSLAQRIELADEEEFAIAYDKYGCYLYTGDSFVQISYTTELYVDTRDIVSNATTIQKADMLLSDAYDSVALTYSTMAANARVQTNFFCSLTYVTQNPHENICWAATIAMISNSVNDTSLSAVDVASAYYGENFNRTLSRTIVANLMNNVYDLPYTYRDQVPSDNAILWNIQNGFPIYASFQQAGSSVGHAGALYGVNVIAGRIVIMDPTFGSTTCYLNSDGDYYYVHSGTGATFVLQRAICRSWS